MTNTEQPVRHFTEAWRTGAARSRIIDGRIHASALHECPLQTQLRYQRAAPTDEVVPRLHIRAQIGTAIHRYFLPLLAESWAARDDVDEVLVDDDEGSTEVGSGPLVAHPDLIVVFTDGTIAIIELKTGGKPVVDAALADEPKTAHLDQCRFGGLLAEQQFGSPMRGYWIYYLDIEDPERHWALIWRAWTDEQIAVAGRWVDYAVSLTGQAKAARWFGRHASDAFAPFSPCLSCEFRTGCLGKDAADPARAEAAAELVEAGYRFGEQVKAAQDELCEFLRLSDAVKAPKRSKSYVGDIVDYLGLQPGTYTLPGGATRKLVRYSGYDDLDGPAAKELLERLGHKPPMKRVAGHDRFM